ncbi:MAG: hypothetical protein COB69_00350 [Phycisphaera sp.]|nr:MAG: hypothetical protein COB69_00350 [Phycisphaera sp.]
MHINDEIKAKEAELEELIKQRDAGPWVPTEEYFKESTNAFYIGVTGSVEVCASWIFAQKLMACGNIYRTREEAEYESARQKALVAVNKIIAEENLANNLVADWGDNNQEKLMINWDYYTKSMITIEHWTWRPACELAEFSEDSTEAIIERITQEQIDLIWRLNA